MPMFPIKNIFPRRWQASTSVMHGVDEFGEPQYLRLDGSGKISIRTAGEEYLTVAGFYRNFWAVAGAPGAPVTGITDHLGNVISDANGWIDVRYFTILSLSAAAQGNFENGGSIYPLNFDGQVRVQRVNHINEPLPADVLTETVNSPSQKLPTDPLLPAIDLIDAAWIRIFIDTNVLGGDCAFFGILK